MEVDVAVARRTDVKTDRRSELIARKRRKVEDPLDLGEDEPDLEEPLADDLEQVRMQPAEVEEPEDELSDELMEADVGSEVRDGSPLPTPDEGEHSSAGDAPTNNPLGEGLRALLDEMLGQSAADPIEEATAWKAPAPRVRRDMTAVLPFTLQAARPRSMMPSAAPADADEIGTTLAALRDGVLAWAGSSIRGPLDPETSAAWADALDLTLSEALPQLGGLGDLGGTTLLDLLVGGTEALAALAEPEEQADPGIAEAANLPLTEALVDRISQALGLRGSADVEIGDVAAPGGARGVMRDGKISLAHAFDPTTRHGVTLLAHEMVHLAQADLPVVEADEHVLAENEAARWAVDFASGRSPGAVQQGLGSGQLAADSGQWGSRLSAINETASGLEPSGAPMSVDGEKPDRSASADDKRKLKDYARGADASFDKIGDTGAFDRLYDAICDEEDAEVRSALRSVRNTSAYQDLCDVWQSAVDGEDLSGPMMKRFDQEWRGRGFWSETEQAYAMVARAAKVDARRSAEAEAARKQRAEAKASEAALAEAEAKAKSQAESRASGQTNGENLAGSLGELGAFANLAVTPAPPQIPEFNAMVGVSDSQIADIEFERGHQLGLDQNFDTPSRFDQITETLTTNLVGGFGKGFVDQSIDTLVLDTMGQYADKGLAAATKGRLGSTPFVGPAITLIKTAMTLDPKDPLKAFRPDDAMKHFGDMAGTWDKWKAAESAGDRIGMTFALLADFFAGMCDLVNTISTICGVLSALCYVVGAILLLIGLIPFCQACLPIGGWLVRAGGVLARVVTVLGKVGLILSALEMAFRTIAAFTVPADMYAEQLTQVGEASKQFGDKAGSKIGDTTANTVKDAVTTKFTSPPPAAAPKPAGGDGQSKTDTSKANQQADSLKSAAQGDIDSGVKTKNSQPGDDPANPKNQGGDDDGTTKPKTGNDDAAEPSLLKKIKDNVSADMSALNPLKIKSTLKSIGGEFKAIGGEFKALVRNPGESAAQGMAPQALKTHLKDKIKSTNEKLVEVGAALAKMPADDPMRAQVEAELRAVRSEVEGMKASLADVSKRIDDGKTNDKGSDDPLGRQKQKKKLEAEQDAAVQKKAQLEDEIKRLEGELAEAQKRKTKSDQDAAETQKKLDTENDHIKRFDDAKKAGQQAKSLEGELAALRTEATALRTQAGKVDAARAKRAEADSKSTEAERLKTKGEEQLAELNGHFGSKTEGGHDRSLRVLIGGEVKQRRVRRFEADGVVVSKGSGEQKIPFADIANQKVKAQAEAMGQQHSKAQELDVQAGNLRSKADADDPNNADPVQLRVDAQAKNDQADGQQQQLSDLKSQSSYTGSDKTAGEHKASAQSLSEQKATQTASSSGAGGEITRINGEITANKTSVKSEDTKIQQTTSDLQKFEKSNLSSNNAGSVDEYVFAHTKTGGPSSGNATGGVGSVWGEMFSMLFGEDGGDRDAFESNLQGIVDRINVMITTPAPPALPSTEGADGTAPPAADTPAATTEKPKAGPSVAGALGFGGGGTAGEHVQNGLNDLFGTKTKDQVKQAGELRANVEGLLAMSPPTDVDEMNGKRIRAMDAMQRYIDAHRAAYAAYQGEQTIIAVMVETQVIHDLGEPIKEASTKDATAMAQSKVDEENRRRAIDGMNTETPGMEGGMAALVAGLVTRMSDQGDRMEGSPNSGKVSGDDMANAHKSADEESDKQKAAAGAASDEQKTFLSDAVAAAGEHKGYAEKTMADVGVKLATEQRLLDEVKIYKAQQLKERQDAETVVKQESAGFSADFANLAGWASTYKAKRIETFGE